MRVVKEWKSGSLEVSRSNIVLEPIPFRHFISEQGVSTLGRPPKQRNTGVYQICLEIIQYTHIKIKPSKFK